MRSRLYASFQSFLSYFKAVLVNPNLKWKQKRGLGSCQLRVDGTCFGTNLIQFEVSLNWMKSWIDPLAKTKLIPNTVI